MHEPSPGGRGASVKRHKERAKYLASHFYPDITPGQVYPKHDYRREGLKNLHYDDESFDLFASQDVMEHIFDPEKAFKKNTRVLKPSGAHIFTISIINKANKTEYWASRNGAGEIVYHHEPEFHGNPIDKEGSLVTMHWGCDIANFIMEKANTPTTIAMIDNLELGIRAEYIEILVSRKQWQLNDDTRSGLSCCV